MIGKKFLAGDIISLQPLYYFSLMRDGYFISHMLISQKFLLSAHDI